MPAVGSASVLVRGFLDNLQRSRLSRLLPSLVVAGLVLAALSLRAWLSADQVLAYLPKHPILAAGFFIGTYALFVVAMLPALPLNLAAGFLFGAVAGGTLATVGGTLGCVLSFVVARYWLRTALGKHAQSERFAGFQNLMERRGWLFVAFIRLNPILPTGPINYMFGLTRLRLWTYTWTTFVFLLPPAVAFAAIGRAAKGLYSAAAHRTDMHLIYVSSAALTLLSLVVVIAFWLRRRPRPGEATSFPEASIAEATIERAPDPKFKTTLLVLTLNEIEGMRRIMPQIQPHWCDQIIIVDGGSTDGTIEWAREHGYEVHVQSRKGIRFAYFEVVPKVTGDVIISFSPDGNCPISAIPDLIAKMREGHDLVIASRYLPGAQSDDDDMLTAFGNWLFTRTVNLLHGGRYTDVMVILRAFRKSVIADLALLDDAAYELPERLFGTVISWEPLMSVRAAKRRLRVAEIAADEPARIGGERKLQMWRWGAAYYFQFWRELWFWRPALFEAQSQRSRQSVTAD